MDKSQYRSIVENLLQSAPWGMLIVQSSGLIVMANRQVANLFDYPRRELKGMHIQALLPQTPGQHAEKNGRNFDNTLGSACMGPVPARRRDGTLFAAELGRAPLDWPDSEAQVFSVFDLTASIQAKQALQAHRHLLQDIIDNTASVIYVKNVDGRYELVNRRFFEIFRLDEQQVIGKTDYDIFPSEIARRFRLNDQQVAQEQTILQFEETAELADGPHQYISVKFPLRDADGDLRAIGGISTDITELVAARSELETTKRRLELILESVFDGIYGLDNEGRTTFMNQAAQKMLGWTADEVLGKKQHALVHHSDADGNPYPQDQCPIYRAIRLGRTTQISNEVFWTKQGTSLPVEYTSSPIIDQGSVVGAVLTFRDTTDRDIRKQSEQEILAARAVQQKLYPHAAPVLDRFDIAGEVIPAAQACGDYYDYIPLDPERLVLVVGDVSGHGLGPALQMVETRALLHAFLARETDLATVLSALNEQLVSDLTEGNFVSLFLAVIDIPTRVVTYIGAGHDALLLKQSGERIGLSSTGFLLGVVKDASFAVEVTEPMEAGDMLVISTDGIVEVQSRLGELYGRKRFANLLMENRHLSAREIGQRVMRDTSEFAMVDCPDDRTILVCKCVN